MAGDLRSEQGLLTKIAQVNSTPQPTIAETDAIYLGSFKDDNSKQRQATTTPVEAGSLSQ